MALKKKYYKNTPKSRILKKKVDALYKTMRLAGKEQLNALRHAEKLDAKLTKIRQNYSRATYEYLMEKGIIPKYP